MKILIYVGAFALVAAIIGVFYYLSKRNAEKSSIGGGSGGGIPPKAN